MQTRHSREVPRRCAHICKSCTPSYKHDIEPKGGQHRGGNQIAKRRVERRDLCKTFAGAEAGTPGRPWQKWEREQMERRDRMQMSRANTALQDDLKSN